MSKSRLLTLLIPLSCICLLPAAAYDESADAFSSRSLTISEGLRHSNVDGLFQDEKGFIWISFFGGGLSRYDGAQFLNFSEDDPEHRLTSDYVTESCEDRYGRIWVASTSGLDILEPKEFRLMELPEDIRTSTQGYFCNFLTSDSRGNVWYTNGPSLFRVSFGDDGQSFQVESLRCAEDGENLRLKFRDIDRDGSVYTALNGHIVKVKPVEGGGQERITDRPCFAGAVSGRG